MCISCVHCKYRLSVKIFCQNTPGKKKRPRSTGFPAAEKAAKPFLAKKDLTKGFHFLRMSRIFCYRKRCFRGAPRAQRIFAAPLRLRPRELCERSFSKSFGQAESPASMGALPVKKNRDKRLLAIAVTASQSAERATEQRRPVIHGYAVSCGASVEKTQRQSLSASMR